MCHVFLHEPNLPLAVRQECVLFGVLQRPLEVLEGFFLLKKRIPHEILRKYDGSCDMSKYLDFKMAL